MTNAVSDAKIDPANTILFVGAGVSVSLGLPSWGQLIAEVAKQLDYDPRVFRRELAPKGYRYFKVRGARGDRESGVSKNLHNKFR